MYCTELERINIPAGVKVINAFTFYYCDGITDLIIPDGVIEIGSEAFYSCVKLKNITLPNSVTKIGNNVFDWSIALENVYCKAIVPPTIGKDVFENNATNRKIHVPTASVEAYKSAEGWNNYADNIVGYDF